MKKRLLSILLSMFMLIMGISIVPFTATAEEEYTGTGTFKQCTGALASGYYVFGVGDSAASISAVNTTATSNWIKFTTATSTSASINNPDTSIVWYYNATAGTFNNGTNYVAWPTTGNTASLETTGTPLTVTETATAGVYNITVTATSARMLRLYGTSGYRFYDSTTGKATFYFFKLDKTACPHTNTEAIGEAKDATCTQDGITAGEKCSACGAEIKPQETIPAGHKYVDGVCSVCGNKAITYALVTDASTLAAGNQILIVCPTKNMAMGAQNDTNYRDGVEVTITDSTITDPKNVAVITLEVGNEENTFALKVSDGYLYWESDNSLNTGDASYAWTITIENDVANITSATTTDRMLKWNASSPRFACYTSGQTAIALYKFVCAHENKETLAEKAATCTENGLTAGEKCTDCGEILTPQETISATGHSDENNDFQCDICETNLCTNHVWVDGDVITSPTCTATGLQKQYCENCGQPGEDKILDMIAHAPVTDEAVSPTCTETGLTEGSHCSICTEVLTAQEILPMTDHNYVDGVCSVCGDMVVTGKQLTIFQFGDNGNAGHKDGSQIEAGTEYTSDNYTLTLSGATKVYGGAFDAQGNSALKLGTSTAYASLSFTVSDEVKKVVISIAGYKSNKAEIIINADTIYNIISKSDLGVYTNIVVDTSTNKTISLTTLSGGYRAMINSITFLGEETVAEEVDKLAGYTVMLGDNIGVNFYMSLTAETIADDTAYMLFTLPNGTTQTVSVQDATQSDNLYKFTANIAVKEMADDIKAQLITVNGSSEEYTYSVKDYAEYIINTPTKYTEKEIALAKAMLNYGAYAQVMFDYKTDTLANSEIDNTLADVTISGDSYAKKVEGSVTGVTYKGTTAMWESDTAIRHYFDITGENVTFTLNDTPLNVIDGTYGKCIVIDGIVAKDMSTEYELVISNGTETQTITYSVYSYFYDILNGDYEEAEKNAVKAAYLYAEAAKTYLAEKNQ